eukprot:TRINITY_DN4081_c0_g2_i1.p1 TRINITY_DN4081_c0_g2~~TRINITY_DN4081_c0_g2_i1.p1  ORF type:complete len:238 (+),score=34.55 TRINITY_DN4081_c0_g2_i1:91-804(+)
MEEEFVSCEREETFTKSNELEINVNAPTIIYHEVCRAIALRSTREINNLLEKYKNKRDVVMVLQILAYAMEYCRQNKIQYLVFKNVKNLDVKIYRLDLSDLISFPKQCCKEGCLKDGTISCSCCQIAIWCDEQCLEQDYFDHQVTCKRGEYCRQNKIQYLVFKNVKNLDVKIYRLDLSDLISFPKQCCKEGCLKDGTISCSCCQIAIWCDEQCLEQDYFDHQVTCKMGQHILNELKL